MSFLDISWYFDDRTAIQVRYGIALTREHNLVLGVCHVKLSQSRGEDRAVLSHDTVDAGGVSREA